MLWLKLKRKELEEFCNIHKALDVKLVDSVGS